MCGSVFGKLYNSLLVLTVHQWEITKNLCKMTVLREGISKLKKVFEFFSTDYNK